MTLQFGVHFLKEICPPFSQFLENHKFWRVAFWALILNNGPRINISRGDLKKCGGITSNWWYPMKWSPCRPCLTWRQHGPLGNLGVSVERNRSDAEPSLRSCLSSKKENCWRLYIYQAKSSTPSIMLTTLSTEIMPFLPKLRRLAAERAS